MAKVTIEYESKYDNGDVVIFKAPNNKYIYVGIIEGYTIDDRVFRFNIRTSPLSYLDSYSIVTFAILIYLISRF